MKEIKRYKLVATESNRNVIECEDGHWMHCSDVEQLQARIKELESEKENAYQQGKAEVICKLTEYSPDYLDEFLGQFITSYTIDDCEDLNWNVSKLKEHFNVDKDFKSEYEKFEQRFDSIYWAAIALQDGDTDKLYFSEYSQSDRDLTKFIQVKINEIKAQGIEEFIKLETERLAKSKDNPTFRAYGMLRRRLSGYLAKLRAKHE